jgi:Rrf2 family protein
MKISARTDYACKALLELALHWPEAAPLQISAIARRQKIPVKYLTQILLSLKQLGLAESIRGQKGGYTLARPPQEISLREVIQGFGDNGHLQQKKKRSDVFSNIWEEIAQETWRVMDKITFDEIIRRERSLNKAPMFTI